MKKLTWLSVIYIRLFGPCQSIGPSFKGKIQDEHESYADIKPLLPSFRTRRSESEESPNIHLYVKFINAKMMMNFLQDVKKSLYV